MHNSENKLKIDRISRIIFLAIAILCASSIVFIVLFVLIKGVNPFVTKYNVGLDTPYTANLWRFIFGFEMTYLNFGILGVVINTLYLVIISSIIALVISIFTALFIVRIAPKRIGACMQTVIELLASIPSIVFGLFGTGYICPLIRDMASGFGIQTAGGVSGLATIAILVMMEIPTITMVSITSMRAIKDNVIHASLALGATKAQTDFKVVIKGAKSGIFAGLILGVGRALGEATAVSLVCGNVPNGPVFNLFDPTSTLTSQMMLGFHEASGIESDIRFSIGITLIVIILVTNVILNKVKRRMERI